MLCAIAAIIGYARFRVTTSFCAWLSDNAHYYRYKNGTVAGISSHYFIDQGIVHCSDSCWTVGIGDLNGPNGGKMDVWDSTGEAAARFLMVDVFCFIVA